jgi:predicted DNA-binding transcriptional regulator AlpA
MAYTELLPLPENDEVLIRSKDLPKYLPVAYQTLVRWRHELKGPNYIKLGGHTVAYKAGDVRKWIAHQSREHL